MRKHDEIMKKLDELTRTARKNYIHKMYRALPLKWERTNAILYLDGVWIAPVRK